MRIIKENIENVYERMEELSDNLNYGDEIIITGISTIGHIRIVGSDFHYNVYSSDAEWDEDTNVFFTDDMDGGICQIGDAHDAITLLLNLQLDLD